MKNTLFLLCEDVTVDSKTNQWTFIKHIEKMNLVVPAEKRAEEQNLSVKGKFNLTSFWKGEGGEEIELKYLLVDPAGDVLMDTPGYKLQIKDGVAIAKHRLVLGQIPIKSSGRYHFKLYKREKGSYEEEAEIGVEVAIKESQEQTPEGEKKEE